MSANSVASDDETDVIESNISVVNALLAEHLTIDELAPDAVRSYYVDYFHAQVMNGGFSQFVYNSRWNPTLVEVVRNGLAGMGATVALAAFEAGSRAVERLGKTRLDEYLASEYFGDNPIRDTINEGLDPATVEDLRAVNARWLRAHPGLVVATIDEMLAEVNRRAAAVPDRAARIARARASEPRDLQLIRRLCEEAGHELERRTAASLLSYEGEKRWGFFFRTDRGAHVMIDLGTKALMFPSSAVHRTAEVVDPSAVVAEIACAPATPEG